MARIAIDPKKKRVQRHVIRANDEEWSIIKKNAAEFKSLNDFAVKTLIK